LNPFILLNTFSRNIAVGMNLKEHYIKSVALLARGLIWSPTVITSLSEMLSSSTIVVFLTCAICTCLIDAYTRLGSGKPPYPPGPRGYPYVGSINIPFKKPWFTYIEWGKKYGGMCPFNIIFSRTLKWISFPALSHSWSASLYQTWETLSHHQLLWNCKGPFRKRCTIHIW